MSATRDRPIKPSKAATADTPFVVDLGWNEKVISRVAVWHEDGDWVVRSLDYDVIAADEDVSAAVITFIKRTKEYADFLLADDDASVEDKRLAVMIYDRFASVAAELGSVEPLFHGRRGGLAGRLRNRRGHRSGWSLHPAALS